MLVTGTDLEGAPVSIEVDGWRARIMQHEFDHLDGVLYVDRLDDGDWKTVQKIARKRGWGRPGVSRGRRASTTSTPETGKGKGPGWKPGPSFESRADDAGLSLPGLDSNQEPIG